MTEDSKFREFIYQLIGWILFLICAVLFTISSIQTGDPLMIAASVFFLLGCFAFIIPLIQSYLSDRG
jgi:predicted membrane channel-forming protein YqfA (hemolysin III family)